MENSTFFHLYRQRIYVFLYLHNENVNMYRKVFFSFPTKMNIYFCCTIVCMKQQQRWTFDWHFLFRTEHTVISHSWSCVVYLGSGLGVFCASPSWNAKKQYKSNLKLILLHNLMKGTLLWRHFYCNRRKRVNWQSNSIMAIHLRGLWHWLRLKTISRSCDALWPYVTK